MTPSGKNCVEVLAPADLALEELFLALRRQRIGVAEGAPFRIVVCSDPLEPGLADVAAQSKTLGRPWLMIALGGASPGAGPLFVPDRAPCWHCLQRRMWLNGHVGAPPTEPERSSVLFGVAAREAARWLVRRSSLLLGRRQSIDGNGALRLHPVVAACPECLPRAPGARLDASFLVSPYTGIAESIEVREAAPGFFRACGSCSQLLIPNQAGQFLPEPRLRIDGKGETADGALQSCLGEAVERYSLLFQGNERRIRGSYLDLGESAVDPRKILLISQRQYQRRAWWQRRHGAFHWITEPFDDSCEIEWVEAFDAGSGAVHWLPAEYCLLGYGGRFAQADSNGCASGATKWQAARNALLELVERDAVSIWWYNRLRRPKVDWEGLSSDRIDNLARLLRQRRRKFWLLDVTTDLEIPTYVAVSSNRDGIAVMLGSGAGLSAETAAWRALTEMTSHVLDLEPGKMPRRADRNERAFWKWWRTSRLADHPYLTPLTRSTQPEHRSPRPPSVEFQSCLRRIRKAGLHVLLCDHTRPELKIPVVRAVVPGLRHWWARFGPGRLYDVPLRMGWRSTSIMEKDVNPTTYFL